MEDDGTSNTSVYAALLMTLEPSVLHAHCNKFLRRELAQTQRSVDDAAEALQRLRDVTRAGQKLQLQSNNEPLYLPFKAVSKLRRRVARALKRVALSQDDEFEYDADADADTTYAVTEEETLTQVRVLMISCARVSERVIIACSHLPVHDL